MSYRPDSKAPSAPGIGRRAARAGAGLIGAAAGFAWRRPVAVLSSVAVIGGAGFFSWNATMQQTTRHPAPLFATPKPAAAKPDQPPQPQRSAELPSPQTTGATRPEAPRPPRRPVAPEASGSIGRATETAAKPVETRAADAKPVVQVRVASAQKALAKLGYGPIAPDGVLGAQTRQALQKFERDRKLPVTGELGPRTVRQLASVSGIAVQ